MRIHYSVSPKDHVSVDPLEVNFEELFREPLVSSWSLFGSGDLFLTDEESKVALAVHRVGVDSFFLDWHHDGRMVVYDGTDTEKYALSEMGGDPFRIPLACLVGESAALQALINPAIK